MLAVGLLHHIGHQLMGTGSIPRVALDGASCHLLKADDKNTIGHTSPHERSGHVQAGRARGASIVGIVDGDGAHAELIENALARACFACAETTDSSLHVIIRDLCIQHGFDTSLEAKFGVGVLALGLEKLGDADAEHVRVCLSHVVSISVVGVRTVNVSLRGMREFMGINLRKHHSPVV